MFAVGTLSYNPEHIVRKKVYKDLPFEPNWNMRTGTAIHEYIQRRLGIYLVIIYHIRMGYIKVCSDIKKRGGNGNGIKPPLKGFVLYAYSTTTGTV